MWRRGRWGVLVERSSGGRDCRWEGEDMAVRWTDGLEVLIAGEDGMEEEEYSLLIG